MDIQEAQKKVAETGKMLLEQGLVARTWGNVSCRINDKSFAITPSGLDYIGMTEEDIAVVETETGEWQGTHKPSGERGVHRAAYMTYSDVNFVIHTHQTYATAIGLAGFDNLIITEEEKKALGGIELAGYGLPGTKKLTENVRKALEKGAKVVLMAHHGALICGKDREDAFSKAVLLEQICKKCTKGQLTENPKIDTELYAELRRKIKVNYKYAEIVDTGEVAMCANSTRKIKAQVDDMAQMIGSSIVTVIGNTDSIINALNKAEAILVPEIGAVVKAENEDDMKAMGILVEKAAICYLHTKAQGKAATLSTFDTKLMRFVYKLKYSKQKK